MLKSLNLYEFSETFLGGKNLIKKGMFLVDQEH